MTTITIISDLATSPQINSRRVAHDLIEWLAHRGWVIVQGQPELPFGCDPYSPAPLPQAAAQLVRAQQKQWDYLRDFGVARIGCDA